MRKYTDEELHLLKIELGRKHSVNLTKLANDPVRQRNAWLARQKHEDRLETKLKNEGWQVFWPTVVCDRIGIKDGKLYLLEFKPFNQKLRPNQQIVADVAGDVYKIFRYLTDEEAASLNLVLPIRASQVAAGIWRRGVHKFPSGLNPLNPDRKASLNLAAEGAGGGR